MYPTLEQITGIRIIDSKTTYGIPSDSEGKIKRSELITNLPLLYDDVAPILKL